MSTVHRPVMLAECLRELEVRPGSVVVDGTAGGGGHTAAIARAAGPSGTVIAIDRDPTMLERAEERLTAEGLSAHWHAGSYVELPEVLGRLGLPSVDAILVDLGLSSDQLTDRDRGFGFQAGGALDLRFDAATGMPASGWLASRSDAEVMAALSEFGDLSDGDPVARAVVAHRRDLRRTEDLVRVVEAAGRPGRTHPATVVLQALRIAVNEELAMVSRAVAEVFPRCLGPGGRLVVLTFHSGEDRIVKQSMARKDVWTLRQKKPILPRPAEVRENPRSRSVKLRAAVRTDAAWTPPPD